MDGKGEAGIGTQAQSEAGVGVKYMSDKVEELRMVKHKLSPEKKKQRTEDLDDEIDNFVIIIRQGSK